MAKDKHDKKSKPTPPPAAPKKVEAKKEEPKKEAPKKNEAIAFPSDAPVAPVENKAPAEAPVILPTNPAPQTVADDTVPTVPTENENTAPAPDPTPAPAETPAPVAQTPPTQLELEEKVLEKWLNAKNNPKDINHWELSYSGVNLSAFGANEATVGKFKFRRSHAGENWQITIIDKLK
jgi:hypothetical protein